jgi:hypothetical protein
MVSEVLGVNAAEEVRKLRVALEVLQILLFDFLLLFLFFLLLGGCVLLGRRALPGTRRPALLVGLCMHTRTPPSAKGFEMRFWKSRQN